MAKAACKNNTIKFFKVVAVVSIGPNGKHVPGNKPICFYGCPCDDCIDSLFTEWQ